MLAAKLKRLLVAALLGVFFLPPGPADSLPAGKTDVPAGFKDRRVESAVREALGKPSGEISGSDLAGLIRLTLRGAGSLSGLEGARNLVELTITDSPGLSDLSALSGLTGLRSLVLGRNSVADISPLAGLTGLKKLIIYEDGVADISPLAGLAGLQSLEIGGTRVRDISPLSRLANLESLELWQNRELQDISPLAGLAGLRSLRLLINRIADISPLAGLTGLEQLSLDDNLVADLSPAAGLKKLSQLTLNLNRVRDVTPLGGLSRLSVLEMDFNRVEDISALSGLKKLSHLSARGNEITDISPAAGLSGMVSLNLNGNRIQSVSPLVPAGGKKDLSLRIKGNSLDLSPGSRPLADLNLLSGMGAEVEYLPQRGPDLYDRSVRVLAGGGPVEFPGPGPFVDNSTGILFIPVRALAEALGAWVDWDEDGQKVVVSREGKTVTLAVGSRDYHDGDLAVPLEAPVLLVNGRTAASLRLFTEALGFQCRWRRDGGGGVLEVEAPGGGVIEVVLPESGTVQVPVPGGGVIEVTAPEN